MVTTTLPVVVQLLERRVGAAPGTFLNPTLFGDVAAMLCRRLGDGKLHWREALVAQLLCMHLLPLSFGADGGLLAAAARAPPKTLLEAQVFCLFNSSSLLCKVGLLPQLHCLTV